MKKVRYLLSAVGAAPALGLLTPAANAAVPAAQATQGNVGKTVSMDHSRTPRTPLANCRSAQEKDTNSANGRFAGAIYYSGNICVYHQVGILDKRQYSLTERTRFYSGGGHLERTTWQAGGFAGESTVFSSYPNMFAHEVCQALVANSNHNDVKYGPVCEKT